MLQKIMGKQHLKPVYKAPRWGDIRHSCANIEKANILLSYELTFTLEKAFKIGRETIQKRKPAIQVWW